LLVYWLFVNLGMNVKEIKVNEKSIRAKMRLYDAIR
jgi:hypothetical protein